MWAPITFLESLLLGVVAANQNAVIALQTATVVGGSQYGMARVGHVAEDRPIIISMLDIERHITAGIATALMGMLESRLTPCSDSHA